MNWNRFTGKLFAAWQTIKSNVQPSYSQAGEDQVMRYLLYSCLVINKPTYLDIGTNHPFSCNNTFYFYKRGSRGVCIEPDIQFSGLIKKYRKGDVFIEAGVGVSKINEADFYVFPGQYCGWSTFSKEEAKSREKESGIKIKEVRKMPLININDVMGKYFSGWPNLISLDVEGLDLDILKSLDFEKYKPEVICVESITFSTVNKEAKINEIAEFVTSKGYFVFADTHVNTIFCRTDAFYKKT